MRLLPGRAPITRTAPQTTAQESPHEQQTQHLTDKHDDNDTIPSVTHIEWRHGEYHAHLSIEMTELSADESVLPLGPRPTLANTATYLSNLAHTIANLQIGDLDVGEPRRHIDGSLRTHIAFTVFRPQASLVTTATAASELEKVLRDMLEQDERTLLSTLPHLFD